jgi:ABC-type nickel/cobalt efflux system permease component RcnA
VDPRRRASRAATVLAFAALALLGAPASPAFAHPLGNFTVNTFAGLHVLLGELRVDYVVDLAEIPAFQELSRIDADGDGTADAVELRAWAGRRASRFAAGLVVTVDGRAIPLEVRSANAVTVPGQAGLSTLRFEGVFTAAIGARGHLEVHDTNLAGRIGWRELTIAAEDGRAITQASVPATTVSDALRAYPRDLLSSPLDVRDATANFEPGPSVAPRTAVLPDAAVSPARPGIEGGPFAGLIANRGPALVLLGLLLAVAFGAWHALLPGHGKTLMAAYLVGSGGRVRHAVTVGGAVAGMHTASVLALGILVLALERTFHPEVLYPWLALASGVAALGLGTWLLAARLSAWPRSAARTDRTPGHDHPHRHAHPHPRHHDDADRAGADPALGGAPLSSRGLVALALAGGILPAPSALLVLLASINLHRIAYGLGLVLAFSLGLAGALVVVGIGALRVRDAVAVRLSGTVGRLVPVLSAAAIALVGLFLTVRGAFRV